MELVYKKAKRDDIETLTQSRIEVLRAANKLSENIDMTEVQNQTYVYYSKALADGSHTAYLVFGDTNYIGTGASAIIV